MKYPIVTKLNIDMPATAIAVTHIPHKPMQNAQAKMKPINILANNFIRVGRNF